MSETIDVISNLEFFNLLSKLNEDEKLIMVLYYSEGYKIREISKILRVNQNTVKSKLNRARRKVEINMKEAYENE